MYYVKETCTVCPLFVKHCFRYREYAISCFHEKAYFVVSKARAKFREVIGRLERVGHIDPENLGGRCEDVGFDSGNWDLQDLCASFNDLLVLFSLFFLLRFTLLANLTIRSRLRVCILEP